MQLSDIFRLAGGFALLLLGLRALREGLAHATGPVIAGMLPPRRGIPGAGSAGFLASALLQSHFRAAAAAVGLTGAHLLSLSKAAGMMAGAQAGSAAAPLLLFLSPEAGAVLVLAGVILLAFHRYKRLCFAGLALAGLGVMVLGMQLLGVAVDALGSILLFIRLSQGLTNPIIGLLLGAGIAGAAGGATAVIGILQLLAQRGLVGQDAVFYMVLGANIGKFVPVLLASAGGGMPSRRAAAAAALGGTVTGLLFLSAAQILPVIPLAASSGRLWVVFLHFGYNAISAFLLLPFSKLFARLAEVLLPVYEGTEGAAALLYDKCLLAVPDLAHKSLRAECCRLGHLAQTAFHSAAHACLYGAPPGGNTAPDFPEGLPAVLEEALDTAACLDNSGSWSTGSLVCAVHAIERVSRIARDLMETVSDNSMPHVPLSGSRLRDTEELLRSTGNILTGALDGLECAGMTRERLLTLEVDRETAQKILRGLRREYAAHALGNRHPRRFAAYLALAERLAQVADNAWEIARAAVKP